MSYQVNVYTGKMDLTGFPFGTKMSRSGNTVTLSIDGISAQDWTVIPAPPPVGSPMGLLLTLTYPA
jgi:hypothetical protein